LSDSDAGGPHPEDFNLQDKTAKQRHHDHRQTDDVENVDAEKIGPRRPAPGDEIFLQAEEQAEADDFSAAAGHATGNLAGRGVFPNQFAGYQSEGNSGEKKEERRGQRPEALRVFKDDGVARIAAEP